LGKLFKWPPKGWRLYILFALATFSFAWITWRYEQAGILVFAILVAVLITIENRQWAWAGFWMALSLIKPNITILVVAGLSLWLLRRSQWRPVLSMTLWLVALLSISTWVTPNWYKPFLEEGFGQGLTAVLDGPNRVVALRINTTLLDWLKSLGVAHNLLLPFYEVALRDGFIFFFSLYGFPDRFCR
jgi:hypothetical protein